ncbi:MAG: type II 3-dehydroquinate dehydratase [Candidatus Melainabacteria bacterium]
MSKTSPHILILNGPNLNLLGSREPDIYGHQTLDDINSALEKQAKSLKPAPELRFIQSNHEGELIDQIHAAIKTTAGLIINPGGYSHTSIALRDALSAYPHPIIEVHLSNIHRREHFRHHSYISGVVTGVICGLGAQGYSLALEAIHQTL